MVGYYGSKVPNKNSANVNTQGSRPVINHPWEKAMVTANEKATMQGNLGFNSQNRRIIIRIMVPPLTAEPRRVLSRAAKAVGGEAKVGIRNNRKEAMEQIKKLQKDGLAEDEGKVAEPQIQQLTDTHVAKVDTRIAQ